MAVGLLPYLAVFIYIAVAGARGDASIGTVFMIVLGLGVAYLVALLVALPGYLWSCALSEDAGTVSRCSSILRICVLGGVYPVMAIFPAVLLALRW